MDQSPELGAAPEAAWNEHLKAGLADPKRAYSFDMDDAPEERALAQVGPLSEALRLINAALGEPFQTSDSAALRNQATHRKLAKWAMWTGASAVLLAIVQPALTETLPDLRIKAAWLEAIAAFSGFVAVLLGLRVKTNNRWFVERHRAERLRMLKFLALGRPELWCGDTAAWRAWIDEQVRAIMGVQTIEQVKLWAESGNAEVELPPPPACVPPPAALASASTYYRWKRVEYQASYFNKQAAKYREQTRRLTRLPLPLFFLSILAVGVHFAAGWMNAHAAAAPAALHAWHATEVWALAVAAVLPVCGLCIKAWLGAFEHTRSASLFGAKARALLQLSNQLRQDQDDLTATMRHIAHAEHFLAQEHREWLRLLLEAEWFL